MNYRFLIACRTYEYFSCDDCCTIFGYSRPSEQNDAHTETESELRTESRALVKHVFEMPPPLPSPPKPICGHTIIITRHTHSGALTFHISYTHTLHRNMDGSRTTTHMWLTLGNGLPHQKYGAGVLVKHMRVYHSKQYIRSRTTTTHNNSTTLIIYLVQ